jgi:SAM-dependent methyltransferase
VSAFAAAWLSLREPYDMRARSPKVMQAVHAALAGRSSVAIVDLACGTGSTFRALSPHLAARQDWRLVDNDLSLLARAPQSSPPRIQVKAIPIDISRDLEAALDGPVDLVTTSALLDLVSQAWLDRLAIEAAARALPIYAALTYDGRVELDPADCADARIVAAVNRHQRSDKGFGPALGPDAPTAAVAALARVGYAVSADAADWLFGPDDREIQTEILIGWATAARAIGESAAAVIGWLERRRKLVADGRSSMRVGHRDLFAHPTGTR